MSSSSTARWLRYRRWGLRWSGWLHGLVAAVLLADWLLKTLLLVPELPANVAVVQVRLAPLPPPLAETRMIVDARQAAPTEINTSEILAAMVDPRWQELVEPVEALDDPDDSRMFVHTELMRIAADAERRSVEENLSRLNDLSDRLEQVSSQQGVDDINRQLKRLLGADDRADKPAAETVEGEFDFTTAQLHDVKRTEADGRFAYTAILVDAAGRQYESPFLNESEGETAYRTMQIIKSNPLLERVYRGVVMSLMDKVLKGAGE